MLWLLTCEMSFTDDELALVLAQYKATVGDSYTVIYAGGPRTEKPKTYTAEFTDSAAGHSELKRQLHDVNGARKEKKATDNRPLFAKYQYFTPGKSLFCSYMFYHKLDHINDGRR